MRANRSIKNIYKLPWITSDRNRWSSYIVPYQAGVKSLILIEVGMGGDEESLLLSSFKPVLSSATFPVNPVVFLNGVLRYIYLISQLLHFGSSFCAPTVWFKESCQFSHIWVVAVLTRDAVDDSCYIIWVWLCLGGGQLFCWSWSIHGFSL